MPFMWGGQGARHRRLLYVQYLISIAQKPVCPRIGGLNVESHFDYFTLGCNSETAFCKARGPPEASSREVKTRSPIDLIRLNWHETTKGEKMAHYGKWMVVVQLAMVMNFKP